MIIFYLIGGLIAGSVIPVQTAINSDLGKKVRSPFFASTISFFVGTITLLLLTLIIDHQLGVPMRAFTAYPWWIWTGGLLGVCYLTSNILLMPRLGAALTVVITLCGQMIMAIAIDQFGWFSVVIHEITPIRIVGVLCMLVGVFLIEKF